MKLIIGIPYGLKDVYEHGNVTALDVEEMKRALQNAIPLEQIRKEIATKLDNPHEYIVKQDAYNEIVDIINSYIKVGAPQDVIS